MMATELPPQPQPYHNNLTSKNSGNTSHHNSNSKSKMTHADNVYFLSIPNMIVNGGNFQLLPEGRGLSSTCSRTTNNCAPSTDSCNPAKITEPLTSTGLFVVPKPSQEPARKNNIAGNPISCDKQQKTAEEASSCPVLIQTLGSQEGETGCSTEMSGSENEERAELLASNYSPRITTSNGPLAHAEERPPPPPPPPKQPQRRTIFGSFWNIDGSVNGAEDGGDSDSQSATSLRSKDSASNNYINNNNNNNNNNSMNRHNNARVRANSVPVIPESPGSWTRKKSLIDGSFRNADIMMMFSPPEQHKPVLKGPFENLHELPADMRLSLPPLPSPLSRICRKDGSLCSGGMYPLTSPRSILQKKTSYGSTLPHQEQHEQDHHNHSQQSNQQSSPTNGDFRKSSTTSPNGGGMIMSIPLSLTDSIHGTNMRRNKNGNHSSEKNNIDMCIESDESSTDSSTGNSTTASASNGRRVHFDPRVTITEYQDRVPRQWYTDTDLNHFKVETISLAQRYLLKNPAIAADYITGFPDPYTGVIRKKTLYSLPVLNDVTVDDDDQENGKRNKNENETNSNRKRPGAKDVPLYDFPKLARIHVRKILIVDPNKLILDLFCKSLRQIFPHAELTAVQTGEDALHQVKQAFRTGLAQPHSLARAYDIVIIEERLHALPLRGFGEHPPRDVRTTETQHQKSLSVASPTTLRKNKQHNSMTGLSDYKNNLSKLNDCFCAKYVSGAEVVVKLKRLEDDFCRHDRCILEDAEFEDPASLGGHANGADQEPCSCWRALVVGVCVDQKHDSIKLWKGGADFVWGKPPPPMGENLRNQLISLLVKKRNLSLTDDGPCHQ